MKFPHHLFNMPMLELSEEIGGVGGLRLDDNLEAMVHYEVVGKDMSSVRLRIKGIMLKPRDEKAKKRKINV